MKQKQVDYTKLLDFYWDLFYNGILEKQYVREKYGNDIFEHASREASFMGSAVNTHPSGFQKGMRIVDRINEVENRVSTIKRERFELQQVKINRKIAIAVGLQAVMLFLDYFFPNKTVTDKAISAIVYTILILSATFLLYQLIKGLLNKN